MFKQIDRGGGVLFVAVNRDTAARRIHDPVFPHAGLGIQGSFRDIIHMPAGGGDDLDHPVGGAAAALFLSACCHRRSR